MWKQIRSLTQIKINILSCVLKVVATRPKVASISVFCLIPITLVNTLGVRPSNEFTKFICDRLTVKCVYLSYQTTGVIVATHMSEMTRVLMADSDSH